MNGSNFSVPVWTTFRTINMTYSNSTIATGKYLKQASTPITGLSFIVSLGTLFLVSVIFWIVRKCKRKQANELLSRGFTQDFASETKAAFLYRKFEKATRKFMLFVVIVCDTFISAFFIILIYLFSAYSAFLPFCTLGTLKDLINIGCSITHLIFFLVNSTLQYIPFYTNFVPQICFAFVFIAIWLFKLFIVRKK